MTILIKYSLLNSAFRALKMSLVLSFPALSFVLGPLILVTCSSLCLD